MKFDVSRLKWIREPEMYSISDDKIEIITRPCTDLWQRTYYHFRNDNAPVLQMETSENWLKASVEYENENYQHLGGAVSEGDLKRWIDGLDLA